MFRVKPGLCMETEVEVDIPLKVASQTLFSMGFLSITKLSKAIPFTQIKFLSGGFPFPVCCLRRLIQGPAQSHAAEERNHATVAHSDSLPHSAQRRGDQPPDSLSLLDADSWAGELSEAGLRRGARLGQGIAVLSRIVK